MGLPGDFTERPARTGKIGWLLAVVGALQWADSIGIARFVQVLQNMAAWYGEDRNRISLLLQRKHLSGRDFHV